ncbi:hypothetical protein [Actinoplanes palleronii]|uniref:Uncharacterized protein n=1 Tax=Actinoplanes palleronii TaxID=113570 RepID=A0ABQ4B435_9ACTN|nr:hypothetical protein [Actinoplanes palleronii]GIE65420.1 hypothetical protein Apa02nite_015280 [Actinoplanes palleronii]
MNTHQVGEHVAVRWPGGEHDFVLEYYDDGSDLQPPPEPDWCYIRGVQVQPEGIGYRWMRTFKVRPVGGAEYELLPVPR